VLAEDALHLGDLGPLAVDDLLCDALASELRALAEFGLGHVDGAALLMLDIICSHIVSKAPPLACLNCCMSCALIMPGMGCRRPCPAWRPSTPPPSTTV